MLADSRGGADRDPGQLPGRGRRGRVGQRPLRASSAWPASASAPRRSRSAPRGDAEWVAVLSSPLDDVEDNVALIRRQILIAGAIALAAASLAGFWAAGAVSRRLRRLRRAAEQVADGDFNHPIPIESSDELGQLARSFNEMQRRLERLDSARKEFIANASHELRTPIFSLGGFVELLETENPNAEERKEFMAEMRGQVERLQKLTADLLDLSKLDADAMEISRAAGRPEAGRPRGRPASSGAPPRHHSHEAAGARPRGRPWRWPTLIGSARSSVSCSTMRSPTRQRERW